MVNFSGTDHLVFAPDFGSQQRFNDGYLWRIGAVDGGRRPVCTGSRTSSGIKELGDTIGLAPNLIVLMSGPMSLGIDLLFEVSVIAAIRDRIGVKAPSVGESSAIRIDHVLDPLLA